MDFLDRLKKEQEELCERYTKLVDFKKSVQYFCLPFAERFLLDQQDQTMKKYNNILCSRISIAEEKLACSRT